MKASRMPKGLLSLDLDLLQEPDDLSYRMDDDAFRQEGLTIGTDFLRMDGVTRTRGELIPDNLDVQEGTIGKGAYSSVRKARWRRADGREEVIALKDCCCSLVDSSRERRRMVLKELKTLCTLESPFLVRLYGAFLHPEQHSVSIAIEFMDLGSLKDMLIKHGRLMEPTVAAISYQMLSGLVFLHDRRMLHRDLKPANVLVHTLGQVKLCDFGISTLLGDESMNRTVVGTTKFMAPERLRAKPYGRLSDMWSFGLIVLEAATGESPWRDIDSLIDLVVTIEESSISDMVSDENVSFRLWEILNGCLQIDASKRIPARLLLKSPWFETVDVNNDTDAIQIVKSSFSG